MATTVACVEPAGIARAQTYPSRPITLICPFGPGTGIDITARIIAQKLEEKGYTIA